MTKEDIKSMTAEEVEKMPPEKLKAMVLKSWGAYLEKNRTNRRDFVALQVWDGREWRDCERTKFINCFNCIDDSQMIDVFAEMDRQLKLPRGANLRTRFICSQGAIDQMRVQAIQDPGVKYTEMVAEMPVPDLKTYFAGVSVGVDYDD